MKLNGIDVTEEGWIALVEDAKNKGHYIIPVPMSAMSQKAALNLATKLNISIALKDANYLFTTTEKATLALLLEDGTLH